ncbi:MAG: putative DCC family thiol-disulfide oxidoreductase YuxK, partial [Urechidicola sp.]
EIDRLRVAAGAAIELVDVHEMTQTEDLPSRQALLKQLHLRTADGRLLVGLDANVAAWQVTPYGWLFRWLRWPGIRLVADKAYDYWAEVRYRRRYGDIKDA